MVEPGFVANLRYEEAVTMSEFTESLSLILLQENVDVEGTSYLFSGRVTELRTSWCAASRVHLIHLVIEDDYLDVEVVFPSANLCKILSDVVSDEDMANADFVTLVNLLGGNSYEFMVTLGPWNHGYFELLLVKLFFLVETEYHYSNVNRNLLNLLSVGLNAISLVIQVY
ncbi:unnamed protein product [Linum trigynum]|uniref:Uncharacterized protein n=1 Tax=Linum trigynum TaxID=586398 RepID=A0AAV2FSN8_9ROSI